ncbi:choice-of-anchor J domain-containing protein [Candidatus Jettenia sp. AMX1]|uniref:choice-of-anchor J domain-containing protein n=1 Tax=Candidatus Jettenia sp. AMX1 TaxID=2293637 RepID=UPI00208B1F11|nr:choice-of-anchor J domain-containing protein [Candidatus Jettenia sp. AMX1]MDL1940580.1 hypothetical protein [Candidatus Jettenia sp. AMX1]GJQ45207.1 MAG: hypothetical protein JETCAE04_09610 [Candidatus Jettenia caeni]
MSCRVVSFLSVIFIFILFLQVTPAGAQVVYEYGFESEWSGWSADQGIWDVGQPTPPSPVAHGGSRCAGTVLDGNYPMTNPSRLISPSVRLPNVSGDEEVHLRFWQWFSYTPNDAGYVQISVQDDTTGAWSDWANISNAIWGTSAGWSLMDLDLTAYAGKEIRIGFWHTIVYAYENLG